MSMIKCPECGNRVSTMAGTCPHCGVRIKDNLYYDEAEGEYRLRSQSGVSDGSADTSEEDGNNMNSHRHSSDSNTNESASPERHTADRKSSGGIWFIVLIVLAIMVGGYAAWDYYEKKQAIEREAELREQKEAELAMQEEQAALWKKISTCNNTDELQKFIDEHPGTTFEGMARDRLDSLLDAQYNHSATKEERTLVKSALDNFCLELSAKNTLGIEALMAGRTMKHFGGKSDVSAEDIIRWVKEKEAKDVIGIHYLVPFSPTINFARNENNESVIKVTLTLEETINRSNATATNAANYKVRCTMTKDAKIISFRF